MIFCPSNCFSCSSWPKTVHSMYISRAERPFHSFDAFFKIKSIFNIWKLNLKHLLYKFFSKTRASLLLKRTRACLFKCYKLRFQRNYVNECNQLEFFLQKLAKQKQKKRK
eukprot:UN22759